MIFDKAQAKASSSASHGLTAACFGVEAKEYLRVPCRLTESFATWTGKVSGR